MGSPNGVFKEILAPGRGVQALALLLSMRPKQWTKNLILFLPLAFTLNLSWNPDDLRKLASLVGDVAAGFAIFCLVSSSIYLVNDLVDMERDRLHPGKRHRPLPSGRLSGKAVLYAAAMLFSAGLSLGFILDITFGTVVSLYVATMVLYVFILRRLVILDVFAIAGGFVARAVAGAVVISVTPSPWLYVCTALGALFIGFAKRRHELLLLGKEGSGHRDSLEEYSLPMLDHLITMLMPSTLIAYILYTFTAENLPSNHAMMLTIPFVAYGIFRYFYLIHAKEAGGNPEDIIIKDIPIVLTIILWLSTTVAVLWAFRD